MRVTELDLSPAALACLRAADIADVDQLVMHSADELIRQGIGATELYEIVCQLVRHDLSLPSRHGGTIRVPDERDLEMFRLRLVEGLTLTETGEHVDLSRSRVRELVRLRFGLSVPPAVKARRRAATDRRRAEREGEK
jgi:Sigma-70, region 4/Bacterial RNA polymerase, alpha chain C terminal domain